MKSTARSRNILFVCTGNVCRSAMAEFMLNKRALERGWPLKARSCGIAAEGYFQVPDAVWAALAGLGIEKSGHTAQLATRELLDWADLVLTMTGEHREVVLERYPQFVEKTHVLRAYAGFKDADVADPIGRSDAVFRACRDKIAEALDVLVKEEIHE